MKMAYHMNIQFHLFLRVTGREVELFLEQPKCVDEKGYRDHAMLELMYATGVRVSELIALNVEDVNLPAAFLRCGDEKRERIIPLYPRAVKALRDYIQVIRPRLADQEEAALYLFGGPEEGDGNKGTPVKQKAAGSGGDPDAPATDAAEEPDVFAGVRDAEPAGAATSPDSDPAPDLALEGDPGEADQGIAEEENEGSAAVAALGRLLGSRQDVPYPGKENVHFYNNINKSGPEDGAFPEGAASVREEEAEPASEEE